MELNWKYSKFFVYLQSNSPLSCVKHSHRETQTHIPVGQPEIICHTSPAPLAKKEMLMTHVTLLLSTWAALCQPTQTALVSASAVWDFHKASHSPTVQVPSQSLDKTLLRGKSLVHKSHPHVQLNKTVQAATLGVEWTWLPQGWTLPANTQAFDTVCHCKASDWASA